MALYKLVDGVRIEMTAQEEADIRAEWAANAAKPRPTMFDSKVADPLIQALIKEISLITSETEQSVIDRLKATYESKETAPVVTTTKT